MTGIFTSIHFDGFGGYIDFRIDSATYLANFKAIETLKGNFARSKHGIWLRNGILTAINHFVISLSLVV
jgi:hypothetical protein